MPSAAVAPGRDPPQPEQPHDVVDAQPAGRAQDAADDVAERRVAGLGQPVGPPRRQPPVLALLVERVGRRADRRVAARARPAAPTRRRRPRRRRRPGRARRRRRARRPARRAARRPAAAPSTRRRPGRRARSRAAATAGESGRLERLRPRLPRDAVRLGQRAEQRELLERRRRTPRATPRGPARGAGARAARAPRAWPSTARRAGCARHRRSAAAPRPPRGRRRAPPRAPGTSSTCRYSADRKRRLDGE